MSHPAGDIDESISEKVEKAVLQTILFTHTHTYLNCRNVSEN